MSVWDRKKGILFVNGSVGKVNRNTPLQSARSIALSAMMAVIYLYIKLLAILTT